MEFRPMHKFAVFLLIACHLVLSVEGRLLKSVSKNDSKQSRHAQADSVEVLLPPTPTKSSDFGDSVEGYKEDFRHTTPGNSPSVGHSFAEDDEDIVEQKPGSISLEGNDKHSIARAKDNFRPTTPVNSPGAGHSFEEDDEDIEKKPASISLQDNGKHSIAGAKEDIRPTNPGHSPGVGHVYRSQNSEPNT